MNDKRRHARLEGIIRACEGAKDDEFGGKTTDALYLARPILLEMIHAYAEQEIAGIGCVCGHEEREGNLVDQEDDRLSGPMMGAIGMTGNQEKEALEESCDAYNAKQDSQFMKHVHALRHVLFVEIKDSFLKEIHARAIHAKYTGDQQYILLLYMQPDQATFLNLVTTGKNLLLKYGYGSDGNYGIVLEMVHQALDETFKEAHDG